MRKALRGVFSWSIYAGVFFLLLAASFEGYLRIQAQRQWELGRQGSPLGYLPMQSRLYHRLWRLFFVDGDPRIQPRYYRGEVSLLPSHAWNTWDFLRSDDQRAESRYRVTTDELGLRITPKASKKAPRILVVGGYQAFGHGVGDKETYSYLLGEKGWRVLNAGVPSANTELVLKLLEKRWSELAPDVVVLDVGMTDRVAAAGWTVIFHPHKIFFSPGTYAYQFMERLNRRLLSGPLGESYLVALLVATSMKGDEQRNVMAWRRNADRLMHFLRERNARVIVLDQAVGAFAESEYLALMARNPGVRFLSIARAAREAGRPENFHGDDDAWLDEFPPALADFYRRGHPAYFYQANFLQGNRHLHDLLAHRLEIELHKLLRTPKMGT